MQENKELSDSRVDGLVECPRCKSHVCYAQRVGSEETWTCMSCGFASTTLMKEGTDSEKQVSERQPKLYRDLKFVDPDGYVWYPSVLAVPNVAMVYLDGTSIEDAEWVGVPIRALSRKERRMKQYQGKNFLMDERNLQRFGKDGFATAIKALGLV